MCIEDTTPFRPSTREGLGSKPLQMDAIIAHIGLFRGHEWLKVRNLYSLRFDQPGKRGHKARSPHSRASQEEVQ